MTDKKKLDPMEYLEAVLTGALRQAYNTLKKKPDRYGWDEKYDTWWINIQAACAEKLVAKTTGLYCVGVIDGRDDGGDVGNYGVRWTTKIGGSLILHPADDDERIFILVEGQAPYEMRIVGWKRARDGKADKFWRGDLPRPAFFIQQQYLNPIDVLLESPNAIPEGPDFGEIVFEEETP